MQPISTYKADDRLHSSRPLIIVGGGHVDLELLKSLAPMADIVAADGGAQQCAAAGLVPCAIIGDMDSVEDVAQWANKTRLIELTEQQTTDFEKSLYMTEAPVTVALGMTGGRFDHTLAALDAVTRYAKDRHIILVDESDLALAVSGTFSFAVEAGERVSVHPLGSVTFARSTGLLYPLDGLRLAPGVRTGTSNQAVDGDFTIEVASGQTAPWLLILSTRNLMQLISHLTP